MKLAYFFGTKNDMANFGTKIASMYCAKICFAKNRNFGPKIKILTKNRYFGNISFDKKSKIWQKFGKNRTFSPKIWQKSNFVAKNLAKIELFRQKSKIWQNRSFAKESKFFAKTLNFGQSSKFL